MATQVSWEHIGRMERRHLSEGEHDVTIVNGRYYVSKNGNRCFGFELVNEAGECEWVSHSVEPQHEGFLRSFLEEFFGLDADDYLPDGLMALEGESTRVRVENL